jgi:hypothetical protein
MSEKKIIHIDSVVFSHFEYTKECDRSILAVFCFIEKEKYWLNDREIITFGYKIHVNPLSHFKMHVFCPFDWPS